MLVSNPGSMRSSDRLKLCGFSGSPAWSTCPHCSGVLNRWPLTHSCSGEPELAAGSSLLPPRLARTSSPAMDSGGTQPLRSLLPALISSGCAFDGEAGEDLVGGRTGVEIICSSCESAVPPPGILPPNSSSTLSARHLHGVLTTTFCSNKGAACFSTSGFLLSERKVCVSNVLVLASPPATCRVVWT